MAINKPEQYDMERTIFACRGESGLQSMRSWLYARRDKINEQWITADGDDLSRLQGEAKAVQKQIKLIDEGPTTKEAAK